MRFQETADPAFGRAVGGMAEGAVLLEQRFAPAFERARVDKRRPLVVDQVAGGHAVGSRSLRRPHRHAAVGQGKGVGCRALRMRRAGGRRAWRFLMATGAIGVARVGHRPRLPHRARVHHPPMVVAGDAGAEKEPLATLLFCIEFVPGCVECNIAARERKGDLVALVSRPAVLGRVVARVLGARQHEFLAHEVGHGFHLPR